MSYPQLGGVDRELAEVQQNTSLRFNEIAGANFSKASIVDVDVLAYPYVARVAHGLGEEPTGYLKIRASTHMDLYDGASLGDYDLTKEFPIHSTRAGTVRILFFVRADNAAS